MPTPDNNLVYYAPPAGPRLVEMKHMVGTGINTSRSFQLGPIIQNPILAGDVMPDLESMMAQLQEEMAKQAASQTPLQRLERSPVNDTLDTSTETHKQPVLQQQTDKLPSARKGQISKAKALEKTSKTLSKKGTLKILNDQTGDPLIDGLTGRVNNTLTETIYSAVDIPKTMLKWGAGGLVLGELATLGQKLATWKKRGNFLFSQKSLTKMAKTGWWNKLGPKLRVIGGNFIFIPLLIATLFAIGGGLLAATKAAANLTGAALLNPTNR